jgi:ketosteroid isomerase-like protein
VVDAFFAAGRAGNFDALVAVLHPDVVVRSDFSPSHPNRSTLTRGATAVARDLFKQAKEAAPAIVPALPRPGRFDAASRFSPLTARAASRS